MKLRARCASGQLAVALASCALPVAGAVWAASGSHPVSRASFVVSLPLQGSNNNGFDRVRKNILPNSATMPIAKALVGPQVILAAKQILPDDPNLGSLDDRLAVDAPDPARIPVARTLLAQQTVYLAVTVRAGNADAAENEAHALAAAITILNRESRAHDSEVPEVTTLPGLTRGPATSNWLPAVQIVLGVLVGCCLAATALQVFSASGGQPKPARL